MMIRKYIDRVALVALLASAALSSCIKNDIPYPVIELEIMEVTGDGFTQKGIDYATSTVTIELEEATDIQAVNITGATYTEGAKLSTEIIGEANMLTPLYTTLYLYQSYPWQITATQSITRSFSVTGQIGTATIDATQRTASVDVNKYTVDLDNVEILSFKLAAEGITTYNPTIEELPNNGFNSVRYVDVTSHGRTERWSVYVNPVEPSVEMEVDAWGNIAWLRGTGDTSDPDLCGFSYCKVGEDWTTLPATEVADGLFTLKVTGLEANCDYLFKAYIDTTESKEVEATTESTPQLPNSGFEEWQKIGKAWYVYGEGDDAFWGNGNVGSTSLSDEHNITTPNYVELPAVTTGTTSVLMESRSIFTVFAAGNLFAGRFIDTAGSNGIIGMGRPFTQRPVSLKGMVKYYPAEVSHSDSNNKLFKGDTDMGSIYIALGTWTAEEYGYDSTGVLQGDSETPIVIDTRSKATFFNSDGDDVIAYGELILTEESDWSEFQIDLEYRDLTDGSGNVIERAHSRVPTHVMVVCSSSRYGDYFTGGSGSYMYIDDFELLYE